MEIKDRIFIVTGASSGIGLSTAIALAERGAKVALFARSMDALKELAQKLPGSACSRCSRTDLGAVISFLGVIGSMRLNLPTRGLANSFCAIKSPD